MPDQGKEIRQGGGAKGQSSVEQKEGFNYPNETTGIFLLCFLDGHKLICYGALLC